MTNDTSISEREREILRLVATGATNQQIANQLQISINTVKVHLRNIFSKIGAVSRTDATVYAMRNGLVPGLTAPPEEVPPSPLPLLSDLLADVPPLPATEQMSVSRVVSLAPPVAELPLPRATSRHRPFPMPLLWLAVGLVAVLAAAMFWLGRAGSPSAPLSMTGAMATVPVERSPTGRWTMHTPLPRPRDDFALAAYDLEGRLFVLGGRAAGQVLAQLDRYDPQTGLWVALADKPTAVSDVQAITLRGRIYVPGGASGTGPTTTFEAYDPREQSWEQLPPLPAPRSRYALTVWEGKIFLIGGWDGHAPVADVLIYDPETRLWSTGPALPSARMAASATVVAGQIYLVGGESDGAPLSESLRLDPSGGTSARWERIAPLPQPVAHPVAITVINALLIFDAVGRVGWQYNAPADAWSRYALPADAPIAPNAALLNTSIFFVANATAPTPGAIGEYHVIFTVFVPIRESAPTNP